MDIAAMLPGPWPGRQFPPGNGQVTNRLYARRASAASAPASPRGAHELVLVALQLLVHASPLRSGPTRADGMAVEGGHRLHLAGGGRDPHFVRGAQLRLADRHHPAVYGGPDPP